MTSVYYVPERQEEWSGRGEELGDTLWERGVFLETPNILERIAKFQREGRELPASAVDIDEKFGGMGVADEDVPVPNWLYEIACPACGADVAEAAREAFEADTEAAIADRNIRCANCGAETVAKDLRYGEPMTFARFYVWVSDCEEGEWEPGFRTLLEEVIGPCQEFWEWST